MKFLVFAVLAISGPAHACLDFFSCTVQNRADQSGRDRFEIAFLDPVHASLSDFRDSPRTNYEMRNPKIEAGEFEYRLNEPDHFVVRFKWTKGHYSNVMLSVNGTDADCEPLINWSR